MCQALCQELMNLNNTVFALMEFRIEVGVGGRQVGNTELFDRVLLAPSNRIIHSKWFKQ